jgi:FKBP-type peptidyl-prolyl cis-trans isomerase SlyD
MGAMSDETVAHNKVVAIAFRTFDPEGTEVDKATKEQPRLYLHGHHNILPGLESALEGKKPGDSVSVTLAPENAYGQPVKEKPIEIRRSELPEGELTRGMQFFMTDGRGGAMPIWIKKIQGRIVIATRNHPLAGITIKIDCEVVSIRDATEEELEHGHVHGDGGHHH